MVINKTVVDLGTFIESLDLTPSFDPCENSENSENSVQWELIKAKVLKMLLVLVARQQMMKTKVFKMGKQVVEVAKWMLQIRAESFFGFRSVSAKIGWN